MELPVTTPSPDHVEFDALCSRVDEFEPLPTLTVLPIAVEDQGERDSPLDAGPLDAGPLDAGPLDAGPLDARSLDGRSLDGRSLDGQILAGLVSPL